MDIIFERLRKFLYNKRMEEYLKFLDEYFGGRNFKDLYEDGVIDELKDEEIKFPKKLQHLDEILSKNKHMKNLHAVVI